MTSRSTVLLLTVLTAFTTQQILLPVLPPLAREIGLSEFQLGLVISAAAVVLAATSPVWGRACDRRGARTVLLGGLVVATIGLAAFALVAHLALTGALRGAAVFPAVLVTRGLVFGAGLAAIPVASLAAVSATSSETERTGAVARVGAMQGLSIALGPALGGLLAVAGLIGPLAGAPLLLAVTTVVAAFFLPRTVARPVDSPATTARVRVSDPRIWPYLLAGFTLFLALGLVLLTVGFLIQDRLALDATGTARTSGAVLFGCGLVLVLVQGVVVPRLRWTPSRLLRVGAPVAVVAAVALALAPNLAAITAAMMLLAAGLGTAQAGYSSGPGLHLPPEQQGGAAGLVTATNGLTFVIGPAAGTGLYELAPTAPFLAAAVAAVVGWVVVLVHPTLRRDPSPAPV